MATHRGRSSLSLGAGIFDEVFMKVNGWLERADLRTLVEIPVDLGAPERQK
jgi:hypothetical protein